MSDKGKIHMRSEEGRVRNADISVCGEFSGLPLVDGAAQSNCDNCRSALLIAPVRDMPVKPLPDYVPEPYPDLEPLEEIRKRRDGRRG